MKPFQFVVTLFIVVGLLLTMNWVKSVESRVSKVEMANITKLLNTLDTRYDIAINKEPFRCSHCQKMQYPPALLFWVPTGYPNNKSGWCVECVTKN